MNGRCAAVKDFNTGLWLPVQPRQPGASHCFSASAPLLEHRQINSANLPFKTVVMVCKWF